MVEKLVLVVQRSVSYIHQWPNSLVCRWADPASMDNTICLGHDQCGVEVKTRETCPRGTYENRSSLNISFEPSKRIVSTAIGQLTSEVMLGSGA